MYRSATEVLFDSLSLLQSNILAKVEVELEKTHFRMIPLEEPADQTEFIVQDEQVQYSKFQKLRRNPNTALAIVTIAFFVDYILVLLVVPILGILADNTKASTIGFNYLSHSQKLDFYSDVNH